MEFQYHRRARLEPRPDGDLRCARLSLWADAARLSAISPRGGAGISSLPGCSSSTGSLYLIWSLGSGHVQRDLAPSGRRAQAYRQLDREHARLKFPQGEEAKRYNVLQKLAYLARRVRAAAADAGDGARHVARHGCGLSRSCSTFSAAGNRRAPSISSAASGIVIFVAVHLVMVLISGVWNNLRSMITGRYVIKLPEGQP